MCLGGHISINMSRMCHQEGINVVDMKYLCYILLFHIELRLVIRNTKGLLTIHE